MRQDCGSASRLHGSTCIFLLSGFSPGSASEQTASSCASLSTQQNIRSRTSGRADRRLRALPARAESLRWQRGSWFRPGRRGEDGVGPCAPPDDVRLAGDAFSPVAEGRPPVAVPCHLEDARVRGHVSKVGITHPPRRGRQGERTWHRQTHAPFPARQRSRCPPPARRPATPG
jgi:hypothetical protein